MARGDKLQGTLDLLILRTVSQEPLHGYGIAMRILAFSGGILEVEEGSLYPALHRLAERKLLDSAWGPTETGRRAKFYSLTTAGRKQLQQELESWEHISAGIRRFLRTT